jgi:hypothetical protein
MQDMKRVKEDFDLIGKYEVQEYVWDHNNHYHNFLLRFVPKDCKVAVDIGCGNGEFEKKISQQIKSGLWIRFIPHYHK